MILLANEYQGAQIATALISLELTVDDGKTYNDTYTRSGKVQTSRLDCYSHLDKCPPPVTSHALAHAYGETTLAVKCGSYVGIASVIKSGQDERCYYREDEQEFAYRFNEYNPDDVQQAYPHFTNRVVTTTSGQCIEYDQVGKSVSDKVDNIDVQKFIYSNNSTNGTISIPNSSLGFDGTTYIYRGKADPPQAKTYQCGHRCILMWAYKNPGATDGPKFYQCPITVSPVSDAGHPGHHVPDATARLAAASIALQGRHTGPLSDRNFMQFQWYAIG